LVLSRNESSASITEKRTSNNNSPPDRRQSEALSIGGQGLKLARNASKKTVTTNGQTNTVGGFESPNKNKTKIWTDIGRRITAVPHQEFLKRKDVTLEEKRTLYIYTILNFLAFIIQVVAIALAETLKEDSSINLKDTPVTVMREIFYVEIALILLLETFFVILPLP
jgi:hypothetical protein